MVKKKDRIFYYDLLRAIAIIAVIICHMDLFFGILDTPLKIISHMTFREIGGVGVPIFLMISGALLLNRNYDLSDFLKRRFTRIIYPFIFWFIVISCGLLYFNQTDLIWKLFNGTYSVTWYFWTLIGIYLFLPIINSFIKEYGEKGVEYFLIIWFITIILETVHSYPLFPNFDLLYFSSFVGYPILGYYLDNKEFNLSDSRLCIAGLAVLILTWIMFVFCKYNNIEIIYLGYLSVPMILLSGGMYIFIKYLCRLKSVENLKDTIIGKGIVSLSLCSYGMYFSHVIALKVLLMFNPKSNLLFPIMFILMIFSSWLLAFIPSKIPYLDKFSGVG